MSTLYELFLIEVLALLAKLSSRAESKSTRLRRLIEFTASSKSTSAAKFVAFLFARMRLSDDLNYFDMQINIKLNCGHRH